MQRKHTLSISIFRIFFYICLDILLYLHLQFTLKEISTLLNILIFTFPVIFSLYIENLILKEAIYKHLPFYYTFYSLLTLFVSSFLIFFLGKNIFSGWMILDEKLWMRSLFVSTIAIQCIWVGYSLGSRMKIPLPKMDYHRILPIRKIIILFLFFYVSIFLSIITGTYGFTADNSTIASTSKFTDFLNVFRQFGYLGFGLFVFYYYDKKRYKFLTYVLLSLLFITGLSYGSKSVGVYFIIIFFLIVIFKDRFQRQLGKILMIALIGGVAVYISYKVVEPFRVYYSQNKEQISSNSIEDITTTFVEGQRIHTNDRSTIAGSLLIRLSYIYPLTISMQYADYTNHKVPEDYQWHHIILAPLYAFVPRFIWSTKPMADFGNWAGMTIFGWIEDASIGITTQGYAYMIGNYFGVVVIFLFLGIFHRVIFNTFFYRYLPLYVFFYLLVGNPDQLVWAFIAKSLKLIVVVVAVYFVLSKRYRLS